MNQKLIISKTPFRISFFGGGTDFSDYFNIFGGKVISTTIDKFAYVFLRDLPPFFNYKTQVTYSKIERVNFLDEIQHPLVRETLKYKSLDSVHVVYDADLPAQSGLGTSSSFAVGLLNCVSTFNNENSDKSKLASDAIHIERYLCKESGGYQDQVIASFGGFNIINFNKSGFDVNKIKVADSRLKKLNESLFLFFTGTSRFSSNLSLQHNSNINTNISQLHKMKLLVDKAILILEDDKNDLDNFGKLLNEAWILKKSFSDLVSNSQIDQIYSRALKAGALGGKILGAGGGGFILFYADPKNKKSLINELKELVHVPFNFEKNGSQIIYKNMFTLDKGV